MPEKIGVGPVVETGAQSQSEEQDGFFTKATIKRNLILLVLLDAIWVMGSSDFYVALQPMLAYFGASYTFIGFITGSFAQLPGTILAPYVTRRFRYKKWLFLSTAISSAAIIGIMGGVLVASGLLHLGNAYLLWFVALMVIAYNVLWSFSMLPRGEYTASCVPMEYRGRLIGVSTSIGSVLSMVSVAVGGLMLRRLEKPASFGYCFIMMCGVCLVGYLMSSMGKEKPTPIEKSPAPWSKDMFKIVWDDKPYMRFMFVSLLYNIIYFSLWAMIPPYMFKELKLPAETQATLMIVGNLARFIGTAPMGFIADKFGPKKVFPYSSLLFAVSCTILFLFQNKWGAIIGNSMIAVSFGLFYTVGGVLGYSLPKPEHRAGYYTIGNLVGVLCLSVGPLGMGMICEHIYFPWICAAAAVLAVLGFPFCVYMLKLLRDDVKSYS